MAIVVLVIILVAAGWYILTKNTTSVACVNTDPLRNSNLYDGYAKNNADRYLMIYNSSMARQSSQSVKVYLSRVFLASADKPASKIGDIVDKEWTNPDKKNAQAYPKIAIKGYNLKKATIAAASPSSGQYVKADNNGKGIVTFAELNPTFKDAYNKASSDILKNELKNQVNAASYFQINMDKNKSDRPFELWITDTDGKEHLFQQFCVKVI